jgi:hypothetical protein
VRSIARLLAAISLVASAGIAAHAAPAAPPPSVFEERGPASTPGATSSDPTLPPALPLRVQDARAEKRRAVLEAWCPPRRRRLLDALETGFPSCHDHAHELGKAAYAITHDMPAVLQACQTRCVSGCMHGVLMEAFTERPGSLAGPDRDALRRRRVSPDPQEGDCIHGVGHGAAYVSDYDIPRA